ncbi:hypothetical protein [Gloeobacter kilaueensis]|nr:hypothetical protein [Gloeobacter kilaueensis]
MNNAAVLIAGAVLGGLFTACLIFYLQEKHRRRYRRRYHPYSTGATK